MTVSTTQFHVHGANVLDDEGGERFQVKVQQLGAPLVTAGVSGTVSTSMLVGAIVAIDFPTAEAAPMKEAGVKRGARVTLSLAVVADKA